MLGVEVAVSVPVRLLRLFSGAGGVPAADLPGAMALQAGVLDDMVAIGRAVTADEAVPPAWCRPLR